MIICLSIKKYINKNRDNLRFPNRKSECSLIMGSILLFGMSKSKRSSRTMTMALLGLAFSDYRLKNNENK